MPKRKEPDLMREGRVKVEAVVLTMGARIDVIVDNLIDWCEEEELQWQIRRRGTAGDLIVTTYLEPPMLDNGCVSAAAWMLADLDRAFSAISSNLAWFSRIKIDVDVVMPQAPTGHDEGEGS